MEYTTLKHLHISFAALSVALFASKAFLSIAYNKRPGKRLRYVTYGVDSVLLLLGVWLAIVISLSPLSSSWFLFKLTMVVLYVVLGLVTIRAVNQEAKIMAFLGAMLTVASIYLTAVNKTPTFPFI